PVIGSFQPCDATQRSGFAASGWSEQREERSGLEREARVAHAARNLVGRILEDLGQVLDGKHAGPLRRGSRRLPPSGGQGRRIPMRSPPSAMTTSGRAPRARCPGHYSRDRTSPPPSFASADPPKGSPARARAPPSGR